MRSTFLEVLAALVLLLVCFMFVEVLKAAVCSITPAVCSLPDVQQCFSIIYIILCILAVGIVAYGIIAWIVELSTRCSP